MYDCRNHGFCLKILYWKWPFTIHIFFFHTKEWQKHSKNRSKMICMSLRTYGRDIMTAVTMQTEVTQLLQRALTSSIAKSTSSYLVRFCKCYLNQTTSPIFKKCPFKMSNLKYEYFFNNVRFFPIVCSAAPILAQSSRSSSTNTWSWPKSIALIMWGSPNF